LIALIASSTSLAVTFKFLAFTSTPLKLGNVTSGYTSHVKDILKSLPRSIFSSSPASGLPKKFLAPSSLIAYWNLESNTKLSADSNNASTP
jgi:hypothetical protein